MVEHPESSEINENVDIEHLQTTKSKIHNKITKLQNKLQDIHSSKVMYEKNKHNISTLSKKLDAKINEKVSYAFDSSVLGDMIKNLTYLQRYDTYKLLNDKKTKLTLLREDEINQRNVTMKQLELKLWSDLNEKDAKLICENTQTKIIQIKKHLADLKQCNYNHDEYLKLVSDIKLIKTKLKKHSVRECPNCKTHLLYENNNLVKTAITHCHLEKTEIDSLHKALQKHETRLNAMKTSKILHDRCHQQLSLLSYINASTLKNLKKKKKDVSEYIQQNILIQSKLDKLNEEKKNNVLSSFLNKELRQLELMQSQFINFDANYYVTLETKDAKELSKKIEKYKEQKIRFEHCEQFISQYRKEISHLEDTNKTLFNMLESENDVVTKLQKKKIEIS